MSRKMLMISMAAMGIALGLSPSKGQGVYWTELITRAVGRAELDDTSVEILLTSSSGQPRDLAVDSLGGWVYWTEFGGNAEGEPVGWVKRANLDGTDIVALVTQRYHDPWGIAIDVDGGKVYWTITRSWADGVFTPKIQRANLDGSGVEDLVTSELGEPAYHIALDVSRGKMYWPQARPAKIRRANLDGSDVEDLVTEETVELTLPIGIAVAPVAGKMYWTDWRRVSIDRSLIWQANLDGTDIEVLIVTGLDRNIRDLALDPAGGQMYWIENLPATNAGSIWRSNLDGTAVEQVMTGLTDPGGIALYLPEPLEATLDIRPGSCPNPLNVRSRGSVKMAVLGDVAFDVTEIDVDSLALTRADGVGESVYPVTKRGGRTAVVADRSTALSGSPCSCQEGGVDGIDDLVLRFSVRQMVRSFELDLVPRNTSVVLTLEGDLLDGRTFTASDCVVVKGVHKSPPGRRHSIGQGRP